MDFKAIFKSRSGKETISVIKITPDSMPHHIAYALALKCAEKMEKDSLPQWKLVNVVG